MLRLRCSAGASLLLVCSVACGQTAPGPPPSTPSAAHEPLSFFEGTWTTADSKAPEAFRETCAWLSHGRRHMVCRSSWQSSTGPREGFSVFSYDAAAGDYLYHGFRPNGGVVHQRGKPRGLGWQFASTGGEGPDRVGRRVTIEPTSAGGFELIEESAHGDGPWIVGGRVVYRRVAP